MIIRLSRIAELAFWPGPDIAPMGSDRVQYDRHSHAGLLPQPAEDHRCADAPGGRGLQRGGGGSYHIKHYATEPEAKPKEPGDHAGSGNAKRWTDL